MIACEIWIKRNDCQNTEVTMSLKWQVSLWNLSPQPSHPRNPRSPKRRPKGSQSLRPRRRKQCRNHDSFEVGLSLGLTTWHMSNSEEVNFACSYRFLAIKQGDTYIYIYNQCVIQKKYYLIWTCECFIWWNSQQEHDCQSFWVCRWWTRTFPCE
jgi:hypothetical protein